MNPRLKKLFYFYFINAAFPGPKAHHVQIAKMIDSFRDNSVEVSLVLRRFRKNFTDDIRSFFGLKNEFEYERISSISFLPEYYDPYFRFSLGRKLESISGSPLAREESVIYTRQAKWIGNIVRLRNRCGPGRFPKVVMEVHQGLNEGGLAAVKLLDGVIVINPALKKDLTVRGVDPERILLAPTGVDLRTYEELSGRDVSGIRRELGLPTDSFIVGYTGHLYHDRGIDTLIRSAKYLDDKCLIVIAGGMDEDLKKVDQLIKNEKSGSKVRLLGRQSFSQIPFYQLASDVLVMPYSKKWRLQEWSSPMKLYEYMAAQRPIVSSDFQTIRDVLDEDSCVFVAPDDPEKLAAAIRFCAENRDFSRSISKKAFQRAANFSWDDRAKRVISFISGLQ